MAGPVVANARRDNLLALLIAFAAAALVVGGIVAFGGGGGDPAERVSAGADDAERSSELIAETSGESAADEDGHDHNDGTAADGHDEGDGHGHDDATGATAADDGTTTTTHSHGNNAPAAPRASTPTTHGDHPHDPAPLVPAGSTTPAPDDHSHDPGPVTTPTTTGHGHGDGHGDGPVAQLADLPPEVRAQVSMMSEWAQQHPTAKDAAANGYPKLTRYFPGIAAHYINLRLLFDRTPFDWTKPEVLLYGGDGPDAPLVGFNYIVYSGANPPDGFPGDFDGWHAHPSLCLKGGIVIGEQPKAECQRLGGNTIDFSGFWLLHVWAVPGWEAPEGIFAHENSTV